MPERKGKGSLFPNVDIRDLGDDDAIDKGWWNV